MDNHGLPRACSRQARRLPDQPCLVIERARLRGFPIPSDASAVNVARRQLPLHWRQHTQGRYSPPSSAVCGQLTGKVLTICSPHVGVFNEGKGRASHLRRFDGNVIDASMLVENASKFLRTDVFWQVSHVNTRSRTTVCHCHSVCVYCCDCLWLERIAPQPGVFVMLS